MKKRTFIKTAGKGGLALATTGIWLPGCTSKKDDGKVSTQGVTSSKNWAWVTPENGLSSDEWIRKLEKAKDAGIDAILLEVYNGNHAFFDTDRFKVEEDLLGKFIPICQSLNLELHAWMWTMPCNNEKIVQEHPDWYAVNGLGESAATNPAYVDYYKFLCPCHPEARDFVQGNVRALASINEIDGVHLDYVRLPDVILAEALQPKYDIVQDKEYPQYDYCYSEHCRKQFKDQTGIDPLKDLEEPSTNQKWRQFRYDAITDLVTNQLVPEARKQNKKVTAAVFPNWQSVRQQWGNWNLDAYLPMLYHNFYNEDINWIKEHTQKGIERLQSKKPVYAGLFMPELSPEELSNAYEAAIQGGGKGISLFSLNAVTDDHWKVLKNVIKS